nr:TPA_asm: hypothetical protein HUJ06_006293 [Nelumbo nucifera]
MSSGSSKTSFFLFVFIIAAACSVHAGKRHIINFRSPNLFPEGVAWDPAAQHFVVGSMHHRSIIAVSDAGVVESLISDPELPPNVTILGLTVDSVNRRLLAVINAMEPLPNYNALAAYDLRSRKRIFLAPLTDPASSDRQIANDVAVDYKGNAYITNAAGNFIWKVSVNGEPSIFSRSPLFTSQYVDPDQPYSFCGLSGIAYLSKGYLLVVQSNTGKMFKVNANDGTARLVLLRKDLTLADDIAVRSDGVAVVVSQHKAWLLKSDDSWGEAGVYDEIVLDTERFPTSVAIREGDRAYVLYGHVDKGISGKEEREKFGIEELESAKESEEEAVWVFV